ncbi:MAG: hypothetical protein ABII00_19340 [Elusimicrobiota bacterium]
MNTLIAVCIAVCLGILTLTHLVALVLLLYTMIQVHRSARAVEVLAYEAHDQVERFNTATKKLSDFAGTVRSGWMRVLTLGLGAVVALWPRAKKND